MAAIWFTKDDVQEWRWEGMNPARPWDEQEAFVREINLEDMADTAAVYLRAAEEGAGAEDLGERATEIAAEAGELDGSSLVNAEQRIRDTRRDLRSDALGNVHGLLVTAMNIALDAEERITRTIHGDGGMDINLVRRRQQANNEYQAWVDALNEAIRALPVPLPEPHPLVYVGVPGYGYRFVIADVGPDGVPHAPSTEGWRQEIRKSHLDALAEAAHEASETITSETARYHMRLTELIGELNREGYDISEGPLAPLLINRDMAYYAAMRLNDMLREGSASSLAEAEGYLAGVRSILRSVYGDDYGNGGALEPRRSLTEAERTYLSDFFDTAALAELGRIGWEGDGRSEGETDARRETEERVLRTAADGLVTILNPAADGDPGAVYSGILHDDLERLERALAAAEPDEADAAEFRSLAHLMTHTSVTPHQDLARFAAETAITVERASAATATGTSGDAVGHGTRDLLDFALRRPDVAPEVLAFESRDSSESNATRFLEGFYAQPADGDPSARSRPVDPVVSEFLATATRLPEGVDPSSPEGRAQAEGALAFLNAVRHGGEHLMWDHAAVVRDVATTWTDADPERFGSFTRLRTFENPWRDD